MENESDVSNEVEIDEPPPPPPMRFKCAGYKLRDEEDRPFCEYKATHRWRGRCPGCGRLYDCLFIGKKKGDGQRKTMASLLRGKKLEYISTSVPEVDQMMGGGLVPGCFYMIAGDPGVGKTTLFLRIATGVAKGSRKAVIAPGEMNEEQLGYFIQRSHAKYPELDNENVAVVAKEDPREISAEAEDFGAKLVLVDSIQTCAFDDVNADAGTVAQIDAAAQHFDAWANDTKKIVFVICHITMQGEIAGSKKLQHLVDGIFYMEKAPSYNIYGEMIPETVNVIRIYTDGKNRYGASTNEAFLEMSEEGHLVSMRQSVALIRIKAEAERRQEMEEAEKQVVINIESARKKKRKRDEEDDD